MRAARDCTGCEELSPSHMWACHSNTLRCVVKLRRPGSMHLVREVALWIVFVVICGAIAAAVKQFA
jgi:hypothetical protein